MQGKAKSNENNKNLLKSIKNLLTSAFVDYSPFFFNGRGKRLHLYLNSVAVKLHVACVNKKQTLYLSAFFSLVFRRFHGNKKIRKNNLTN